MPPAHRKIVFHMPSLVTEDAGPQPNESARPAGLESGDDLPESSRPRGMPAAADDRDVRKLATLLEVSQALAGSLSLQTGLYGVLEVLERRCGAVRGAVTLLEEASGLLVVEAALG